MVALGTTLCLCLSASVCLSVSLLLFSTVGATCAMQFCSLGFESPAR